MLKLYLFIFNMNSTLDVKYNCVDILYFILCLP